MNFSNGSMQIRTIFSICTAELMKSARKSILNVNNGPTLRSTKFNLFQQLIKPNKGKARLIFKYSNYPHLLK